MQLLGFRPCSRQTCTVDGRSAEGGRNAQCRIGNNKCFTSRKLLDAVCRRIRVMRRLAWDTYRHYLGCCFCSALNHVSVHGCRSVLVPVVMMGLPVHSAYTRSQAWPHSQCDRRELADILVLPACVQALQSSLLANIPSTRFNTRLHGRVQQPLQPWLLTSHKKHYLRS